MTKKEEDFESMCRLHDLTFEYSDDPEAWRLGLESLKEIKIKARAFDKEEVKRIWNKVVDEKVSEPYRAGFYWKDRWFDQ